jgi:hypothetical protein
LVDLDGDGHLDLISGSWPGEIFFFRGDAKRNFALPVKLKHKTGKTMNIGGGLLKNGGGDYVLVAGDATFEKDDKGRDVIVYEGEKIPIPEGKQGGITGTASTVHAVDWDGDGKVDLLVGNIGGQVYFVPNEGTKKEFAFGQERPLEAGGKPIQVPHGDAAPYAADWDGDGKLDLLVGAGDGSVWFYRNTGSAKEPKLAAGVQIVPPGKAAYDGNAPKEPTRGIRAKICAIDYNGDGKLDLLVGDFATQKPDRPEPTPAEKAEHDKLRKEQQMVQKQYQELIDQLRGPKAVKDKAERERVQKELQKVGLRMSEIYSQLPREYENHGWVWLFLRQDPARKAAP